MKVLHVIPSIAPRDGGPSKAMIDIEHALSRAGVEVVTATSRPRYVRMNDAKDAGVRRHYVHTLIDFYKFAPAIAPWLWHNARQFDVIHIHALFSFTSVVAGTIARLRRVPYVVRPLGTLGTYGITTRRPWMKQASLMLLDGPILRSSAAVHFTSEAEFTEAASLKIPFRGVVIPLGVPKSPEHDPTALARDFSAIVGRRRILYLSRLDPKKNVEVLLHAFSELRRVRHDLILLIAGDGPPGYVAELKSIAARLEMNEDVLWLGHIEGDRKAAALAAADVFVLPSFSENFGIAAVEAMLAGLPVVLGKGVAVAREAEVAGAGYCVEPTGADIARAIERLLDDEVLRRKMAEEAREFAEREYSVATMAQRLINLYEDVVSRRIAAE